MRRRIPTCVLIPVFSLLAVSALAATGEVRVPAELAKESVPPPHTRTCAVQFNGRQTVGTVCQPFLYEENWDGPVLLATNRSGRTLWVSYLHEAADGRVYQGPCYSLPAMSTRAIPDQTIQPLSRRQVNLAILPGFGFPTMGAQPDCKDQRQIVANPPEWADLK